MSDTLDSTFIDGVLSRHAAYIKFALSSESPFPCDFDRTHAIKQHVPEILL